VRLPLAHGTTAVLLVLGVLLAAGASPALAQAPRESLHGSLHGSLRGSPESVDRMWQGALDAGLGFYTTPTDVRDAASTGALVPLTGNRDVRLHRVAFPYVAPATYAFVEQLGARHRQACGQPLVVTSATRPSTRQPDNSVGLSVHPTGMAVDLYRPTGRCLRWLRTTLLELESAGAIEATEERRPAHFHVAVFPTAYARYAVRPATDDSAARVAAVADVTHAAADPTVAGRGDTRRDQVRDSELPAARGPGGALA
jgi:hypothetical protein